MPTLYLEKINGAQANYHVINGWGFTRAATVADLTGYASQPAMVQGALDFLRITIGDTGSTLSELDESNFLEQFVIESVGADVVNFKIIYKGYPATQIEINSSLTNVESNKDADGGVISVSYTYPSDYVLDPAKAGKTIVQGGFISKSVPGMSVTFRWLYTGSGSDTAGEEVTNFAQDYVGMVNESSWDVDSSAAARTWLCSSVHATSRDGGVSFEMAASFEYREDTWDFLVVYINPDDGKPPHDLVSGTGYKLVKGYRVGSLPDAAMLGL